MNFLPTGTKIHNVLVKSVCAWYLLTGESVCQQFRLLGGQRVYFSLGNRTMGQIWQQTPVCQQRRTCLTSALV